MEDNSVFMVSNTSVLPLDGLEEPLVLLLVVLLRDLYDPRGRRTNRGRNRDGHDAGIRYKTASFGLLNF